MAVAYISSDTLTGIRTPLCRTSLGHASHLVQSWVDADGCRAATVRSSSTRSRSCGPPGRPRHAGTRDRPTATGRPPPARRRRTREGREPSAAPTSRRRSGVRTSRPQRSASPSRSGCTPPTCRPRGSDVAATDASSGCSGCPSSTRASARWYQLWLSRWPGPVRPSPHPPAWSGRQSRSADTPGTASPRPASSRSRGSRPHT